MITAIALNIVLAATVFIGIVAMLAWAIHTSRPSVAASAPAHNPRVREQAVLGRAAHADRARAAGRSSSPVGA